MAATQSATATAAAEWKSYWYLPPAAALGYATSVLHIYSLGPFFAPLQQAFGWSRAQTAAGITVSSLISALCCIPTGIFVDRIGPRRIGLIGVLVMAAVFALLGGASGTTGNWLLLWSIVAFGTFGVQATVWTSAVASRFEISRGFAFAITLSGASFAATIFPMLATWLIGSYGWRTAFPAMAGLWAAVVFPVLLLLFRGAKDKSRKLPVATVATDPALIPGLKGVTLAEGMRMPSLYKLFLASALFSFTVIGVMVHFVPILKDSGATPLAAASIASLIGIFSIVGRLGTGLLLDRFPGHWVGAISFMIPIVGCVLLLLDGTDAIGQSIAAACFGLTVGSEVDVMAYLAARHFGLKNFGALYGVLQIALALGTAFGPLAAGAVFDHAHSYAPFLMLTIGMALIAAIALLTLGHPQAASADLKEIPI